MSPRERVAVVVNGAAGQVTGELVEILDQIVKTGDLFVSHSLDEVEGIARSVVERGYGTVMTGGGDGTFTQMVTGITRIALEQGKDAPRFGMLRLGTGNALAWVLGSQNDGNNHGIVTDLARVRGAGTRKLRFLEVQGTLTPFAGLGLDATALGHYGQTRALLRRVPGLRSFASGLVAYGISIVGRTMPEYFLKPQHHVRIVNDGASAVRLGLDGAPLGEPVAHGEVLYEGPMRMVCMSTIPYWGFGARIFPFANERKDRFSLRVIDMHAVDVMLNAKAIWDGSYRSSKVHDFLVHGIQVHCDGPLPLQVGGDPAGEHGRIAASLASDPIEVVDYYAPPDPRAARTVHP